MTLLRITIRLQILLIAVISAAWAETKNIERSARAPERQIKYNVDSEYEIVYPSRKPLKMYLCGKKGARESPCEVILLCFSSASHKHG